MQHFAKPENALKRADELFSVGQNDAALVSLYDVLSSKRHRTWQQSMEDVAIRFVELCVDMRKAKAVKDGLIQYRMVCQGFVGSMDTVLRKFMQLAERAAQSAIKKAAAITDANIEELLGAAYDLDAEETPESLMMATVGGGADSKKRTERQLVTPSLKFLWEAYRSVLDVLRNNAKLDELYRDTCIMGFEFCIRFQRTVEFRRMCDILRNHIQSQTKYDPKWKDKEPPTTEALQTHLETRFSQVGPGIPP
jgi:translation initiation factor 3 subunit A